MASVRWRMLSTLTCWERAKLASEAADMMPWKRKTACRGWRVGCARRVVMKAGEVMSPLRVVAWCG
jgi:hypothetical protein